MCRIALIISITVVAIVCLASRPAQSIAARVGGMSGCLTPGQCHDKQWNRMIFPLRFRPVLGCKPKPFTVRSFPGRRQVALTFDDGPSPFTPRILAKLRRAGIPATFFVVGKMIAGRQPILRKAMKQGSILGNHSWSHPLLPSLARYDQTKELADTNWAIQRATGYRPCLARPPYGAIDGALAAEFRHRRLQPVLWDVDSADWERPSASVIASRVLSSTKPGSIILLHDGGGDRSQTLAALPEIIKGLRRKRLHPVTLTRLLGLYNRHQND